MTISFLRHAAHLICVIFITGACAARHDRQIAPEGCHYEGRHYEPGDVVPTGERCLTCKCGSRGGAPLCRLQVCPELPVPPPRGCVLVHRRNECCQRLICETAYSGYPDTASRVGPSRISAENFDIAPAESGCVVNGTRYGEGSATGSSSLCEYCYCVRGEQRCVKPQCEMPLKGCTPKYRALTCCPVSYDCNATETQVSSTTPSPPRTPPGCLVDGERHSDGAQVRSLAADCERCYCLRGAVRCIKLECAPPLMGCSPVFAAGRCCPVQYNCSKIMTEPAFRERQDADIPSLLKLAEGERADIRRNREITERSLNTETTDITENTETSTNPIPPEPTSEADSEYLNKSTEINNTEPTEDNNVVTATTDVPTMSSDVTVTSTDVDTTIASSTTKPPTKATKAPSTTKPPRVTSKPKTTSTPTVTTSKTTATTPKVPSTTSKIVSKNTTQASTSSKVKSTTTVAPSTTVKMPTSTVKLLTTSKNNANKTQTSTKASPTSPKPPISPKAPSKTTAKVTTTSTTTKEPTTITVMTTDVTSLHVIEDRVDNLEDLETTTSEPEVSTASPTLAPSTTSTTTTTLSPILEALEALLFAKNKETTPEDEYGQALPPSLPNITMIPFLPEDAVVDKKKDSYSSTEGGVHYKGASVHIQGFSPPEFVTGGFVPRQPPVLEDSSSFYHTSPQPDSGDILTAPQVHSVSHISITTPHPETGHDSITVESTITMANPVASRACISPDGREVAHGEVMAPPGPCEECRCDRGTVLCHEEPGCTASSTVASQSTAQDRIDIDVATAPSSIGSVPALSVPENKIAEDESGFSIGSMFDFLFLHGDTKENISPTQSTPIRKPSKAPIRHRPARPTLLHRDDPPPPPLPASIANILKVGGCNIYGRMYRVGRIISELSGPCRECMCTEVGVQCHPLGC